MNTLALAFAFGIAAGPTVTSNTPQDDFITPAAGKIIMLESVSLVISGGNFACAVQYVVMW